MKEAQNRNLLRIKGRAMTSSSIESYTRKRGTISATEGLQAPPVQQGIEDDLRCYVQAQVYSTIAGGKIFFAADPETAYNEFVELLSDPKIKEEVIEDLTKRWIREPIPEETPEEAAAWSDYVDYLNAENDVHNLKAEYEHLSKRVEVMKAAIDKKYPGQFKSVDRKGE